MAQGLHLLNTIIFKYVYWYMKQISGERLQDHWSSGFRFGSSVYQSSGEYPWSGYKETDRGAAIDLTVILSFLEYQTLLLSMMPF